MRSPQIWRDRLSIGFRVEGRCAARLMSAASLIAGLFCRLLADATRFLRHRLHAFDARRVPGAQASRSRVDSSHDDARCSLCFSSSRDDMEKQSLPHDEPPSTARVIVSTIRFGRPASKPHADNSIYGRWRGFQEAFKDVMPIDFVANMLSLHDEVVGRRAAYAEH